MDAANECGGYSEEDCSKAKEEKDLTVGFGHDAILSHAGTVIPSFERSQQTQDVESMLGKRWASVEPTLIVSAWFPPLGVDHFTLIEVGEGRNIFWKKMSLLRH